MFLEAIVACIVQFLFSYGAYILWSMFWKWREQPSYEVDRLLPVKSADFRRQMKQAIDFVTQYLGTLRNIQVRIQKEPGFLYHQLDKHSPSTGQSFDVVMRDLRNDIMPHIGHWLHPQWHAYFPSGCSFPDIVADAIISSLGVVQFSWDAAPAFTELEIMMVGLANILLSSSNPLSLIISGRSPIPSLCVSQCEFEVNWLGRGIGLSEEFLFDDSAGGSAAKGKGGGALQPSSSDAVFVTFMAARYKKIRELVPITDPDNPPADVAEKEAEVLGRMVAYFSLEAHSCYMKAAKMCMVQCRLVATNDDFTMRMDELEAKISADRAKNLIPFLVGCTSG